MHTTLSVLPHILTSIEVIASDAARGSNIMVMLTGRTL
jgi:hypothetical protein